MLMFGLARVRASVSQLVKALYVSLLRWGEGEERRGGGTLLQRDPSSFSSAFPLASILLSSSAGSLRRIDTNALHRPLFG